MKQSKPIIHGRDHAPGGADPIPDLVTGGGGVIEIKVTKDTEIIVTGEAMFVFAIGADLNGLDLVDAQAYVSTVSSSGAITVQVRNITQGFDMLSTAITIDVGEFTSYTATTASVVDAAHQTVATGDLIAIDIDGAGTGAEGLGTILQFDSSPTGRGAVGPTGATGATGATGSPGSGGEIDYVQITSPVAATTGTTVTVITGNAHTYDGSTRVKLEVCAPYVTQTTSGGAGYLILFDGATEIGVLCAWAHSATDEIDVPGYGAVFLTPSAASHTYTIKVRSPGAGTATVQAGNGGASTNNFPAWYRITAA